MDFFENLSETKKLSLMLENLYGAEKVTKVYEEQNGLFTAIDVENLSEAVERFNEAMIAEIPHDTYDNWCACDYIAYTEKNYGNSYWNEIPNHKCIGEIMERFLSMFDAEQEPEMFIISLYDLNDYEIGFANEDDLKSFIYNYNVAPYVVFSKNASGSFVEQYSE